MTLGSELSGVENTRSEHSILDFEAALGRQAGVENFQLAGLDLELDRRLFERINRSVRNRGLNDVAIPERRQPAALVYVDHDD